MQKRAKDITYGDKLVSMDGIVDVTSVDPDMDAGTVLVGHGDTHPTIYGITETVETLN
ncbi:hypothetical protein [Streptomyces sp. NPDC091212]|uniref:hypothetical protein n=1 Tax=Streptomyces sp. NPDC091212 TaxID=3155191 RepID=UPI00344724B9